MNDISAQKPSFPKAMILVLCIAVILGLSFVFFREISLFWVKSLHVVAVISWMAGMLYLPRLFIYHTGSDIGSEMSETFKIMEFKLLKIIINPAMIVTWLSGLWLAFSGMVPIGIWFVVKFIAVIMLSGFHGSLAKHTKRFAQDVREKSEKYWRIANEVPTILMIVVVIMVIVKPFD